jgi:uncharacterized protein (DUF1800 family)
LVGWKAVAGALVLGGFLWLVGCGGAGGTSGGGGTPTPQVTVTVSGAASQVRVGATVQMTAAVANSTNQSVTWLVNGTAGGSAAVGMISTTGLYTAPAVLPNPNTVTISAASVASPGVSGTLAEAVLNPLPVVSSAMVMQQAVGTTYALDVLGAGFLTGSTIDVNGSAVTTVFVSAGELQATLSLPAGTTSIGVTVVNPDPGGTGSAMAQAAVTPIATTLAAAARLLDQATFGPTLTDIQHVQAVGISGYLAEQFGTAPSLLADIPTAGNAICLSTNLTQCEQSEWWQAAITGKDQLRQRVAFALSEIFVVSTNSVSAQSVTPYQNILLNDAFGNFYTLMHDVTLSTAMGGYLNMLGSNKPGNGQIANENYSRENMQLFTIGLNELNQDGSAQLDGSGDVIPTYTQAQVQAFARAYTGWTYATAAGGSPAKFPNNTPNYDAAMASVESAHDVTAKTLLNGTVLSAGGTAEQDLTGALTNIFNHSNVGPFVGKQLIQHLVTSNPSPAYVTRVATVFANNGAGVRGDLKAVITAILTDPEARAGDTSTAADGGHLREGALYVANVIRGLGFTNTSTVGDYSNLGNYSNTLSEKPFASPSVFNFFPPDYVIPGSTLTAPEFGDENTASAIVRLTLADNLVYNRIGGFTVNLSATGPLGVEAANPANLVDSLGVIFMHGQMPAAMRTAIINHISTLTDMGQRVRVAVYLIITSSQYKIIH